MLEVVPGILVTFETGFPATLNPRLMLGIQRVPDMRSTRPVTRLAPLVGSLVEGVVRRSLQGTLVARMTPDTHLVADVGIRLSCLRERDGANPQREDPRE
jgi:hypothetical protein